MTLFHFLYLCVVLIAILTGALLSRILLKKPATARWTSAFAAGVLLAICFLYLIPESFHLLSQHPKEVAEASGREALWVGCALSLGFLSILSIERYFLQIHHHAACHAHEHSHSAPGHHTHDHTLNPLPPSHEQGAVWSLIIALSLHSMLDGVALRSIQGLSTVGLALGVGLILHKIPETASLMTMLRKGNLSSRTQMVVIAIFSLSTPLGLFAAHKLEHIFFQRGAGLLMAFAAGSLMHLVTGHLLPETTEPTSRSARVGVFGIMLTGFLIMLGARILGAG